MLGKYSVYILGSYGIVFIVFFVLTIRIFIQNVKLKRQLAELESEK